MNKEGIFSAVSADTTDEKFKLFGGNLMSLTLIYSTFVFALNILTIIIAFKQL